MFVLPLLTDQNVRRIRQLFLSYTLLKQIEWKKLFENCSEELQEDILTNTVDSNLIQTYPIKISYQKLFLKSLIHYLETQESVIIVDGVFTAYARLVALPTTSECYKYYLFDTDDNVIILKENINIISEGTTGLCTWQASLALAEWAYQNEGNIKSKNILELGSGVGLTGLAIILHCHPNNFTFTDCHPSVLNVLCENIRANIGNTFSNSSVDINQAPVSSTVSDDRCVLKESVNSSIVQVLNLPWETITSDFCMNMGKIDLILAADVVYDDELFEPLISAVKFLFNNCGTKQAIFACTERNKSTLDAFIQFCSEEFKVAEIEAPSPKMFMWSQNTPVKFFKLHK